MLALSIPLLLFFGGNICEQVLLVLKSYLFLSYVFLFLGPKYDWRQTEELVTMVIAVDGVPSDRLNEIDASFADNDVTIKFPGSY